MDLLRRTGFASLTDAIGSHHSSATCVTPADPVMAGHTAAPSRMSSAGDELRLPFRHAGSATKGVLAMKVRRGARELFAAPFALFGDLLQTFRAWLALFRRNATDQRAIPLLTLPGADGWLAAVLAHRLDRIAPSSTLIADTRTVPTIRPAVLRVKPIAACFALARFGAFHASIIPHIELEERYCEIAANRLRQAVLPLATA